jgi:altronate dehydratase large subunit
VTCANHVVNRITQATGAIPITHTNGCLQIGADLQLTQRTLLGCARSPNVGAVLFVGLGCEQTPIKEFANSVTNKPCELLVIQEVGGTRNAIQAGIEIAEGMKADIAGDDRNAVPISGLRVGLKCGGSDYTTAIASNPAVGVAADLLVDAGAGVFLTETTGFPGSEHILARHAASEEVGRKIYHIVDQYRDEIKSHFDRDFSDGNPSPGNIEGGITTLVEKSIGTIKKAGSRPIRGVLEFADDVTDKHGVWIMDTPGHDVFSVSGPAAGGAHLNLFTTGRGSPLGNAINPVIKICGNPHTYQRMQENMDINAGLIMTGEKTIDQIGGEIYQMVLEVAGGKLTKAEELEHREFAIPRIGSTL